MKSKNNTTEKMTKNIQNLTILAINGSKSVRFSPSINALNRL